jgi:hypothetical protein
MEQRIGGLLQTPLRTSAESFVDESHIVANFSLFRVLKLLLPLELACKSG